MSSEQALVVSFRMTEEDVFQFMVTRPSYFSHIGYWFGVGISAFSISLFELPVTPPDRGGLTSVPPSWPV